MSTLNNHADPSITPMGGRRINLEFNLMAPGKNWKQRSDCFFLLYTITTNISETFTNLWHRESIKIMVWKTGVRTFKIGENRQKSPKPVERHLANVQKNERKQVHTSFFSTELLILKSIYKNQVRWATGWTSYLSVCLSVLLFFNWTMN